MPFLFLLALHMLIWYFNSVAMFITVHVCVGCAYTVCMCALAGVSCPLLPDTDAYYRVLELMGDWLYKAPHSHSQPPVRAASLGVDLLGPSLPPFTLHSHCSLPAQPSR